MCGFLPICSCESNFCSSHTISFQFLSNHFSPPNRSLIHPPNSCVCVSIISTIFALFSCKLPSVYVCRVQFSQFARAFRSWPPPFFVYVCVWSFLVVHHFPCSVNSIEFDWRYRFSNNLFLLITQYRGKNLVHPSIHLIPRHPRHALTVQIVVIPFHSFGHSGWNNLFEYFPLHCHSYSYEIINQAVDTCFSFVLVIFEGEILGSWIDQHLLFIV